MEQENRYLVLELSDLEECLTEFQKKQLYEITLKVDRYREFMTKQKVNCNLDITQHKLKSNGNFSIIREPYSKSQHPNQQCGLDQCVDVLDHYTGVVNSVKLHENTKGLHFKKGGSWYLTEFNLEYLYVPYQIISLNITE